MSSNDIDSYIQMLITTLQKQVAALEEVLQETKKQSEIANMPEFDELLLEETLNKKEILIAKLNEYDDGFSKLYSRVRGEILKNQESYKTQIVAMQELIKKSTDLGVEIRVLEERNRDKLMTCFANKGKQYGSQRNAATVASKYHQTMQSGRMNNANYKF